MNVGILNMIEIRDELSSCCDDGLLKECDLLVFREYGTGFAPALGGARMGVRACKLMTGLAMSSKALKGGVVLLWVILWREWLVVPLLKPLYFLFEFGS